ncbi:MAG: SLC13 family permease, partial [Bacteroidetes bacterium]|nr:SLC13 family permease [Bacteroidota bacterium]
LMIPIALAAATELGVDPIAFAVIVAIAASASFISPIGYQTNLMVMGPGGYRFVDYFKVGLPVTFLVMATTVAVVFVVWIS